MSQQPLQGANLQQALRDNVQGDILGDGFLKQVESFFFFNISNPSDFRKRLPQVIPLISNVGAQQTERARVKSEVDKIKAGSDATSQDARDKVVNSKQANIAFTVFGLQKLSQAGGNFSTDLRDTSFQNGMQAHAVEALHDPSSDGTKPNWNPAFLGKQIDGVLLIAANSSEQAEQLRQTLVKILDNSISQVINVLGSARPGQLRRHEHFGYLDGVSEPGVIGFDTLKQDLNNDQREDIDDKELYPPGTFLCKRDGDFAQRPDWTQDGSFLVFRWLEQRVPEFNRDLGEKFAGQLQLDNTQDNRDLIGARIIGRWKSGALIMDNPTADPLPLSAQVGMTREAIDAKIKINNHITFDDNVARCPFGSHIRKVNPRAFGDHRIIRRGIQFGPEVSDSEIAAKKTDPSNKRGLLFACYQSSIDNGFAFIQQVWANSESFPGGVAGIDPMVGQGVGGGEYNMGGLNRNNIGLNITIPRINPYVVTLGDSSTKPPPSGPTVPPTPSGATVPCFVENLSTGSRPTAKIPIDNKSHVFSELWGNGITGNSVGINGNAGNNIVITITGNGKTMTLPNTQTPVQVSSSAIDLSKFTILGRQTS